MGKHTELPVRMEKYDGRIVDANGDYVPTNDLVAKYNYHARLVEALRVLVEVFPPTASEEEFDALEKARTLLAQLDGETE